MKYELTSLATLTSLLVLRKASPSPSTSTPFEASFCCLKTALCEVSGAQDDVDSDLLHSLNLLLVILRKIGEFGGLRDGRLTAC